jgi:hypothetical protein
MKRGTLLFIVSLALAGSALAQQAGSPSNLTPGAPPTEANQITITPDEWQELRAARSAALQANPDFVKKHNKLLERLRTLEDKLDAAMIKADPAIAPMIAKFEANRTHPGAPVSAPSDATVPAQPPPK